MAITRKVSQSYRRKSAEKAPGDIDIPKAKAPAAAPRSTAARTNTRTVVKSYSLPVELCTALDDWMFEHRERSASKVAAAAIARYIGYRPEGE